jgi:hypothetical protein
VDVEQKPTPLTAAELQVQRLEAMKLAQTKASQESAEKAFDPGRTFVEKTIDRLQSMKASSRKEAMPGKPSVYQSSPGRIQVRGVWKGVKLTEMQVKALDKLVTRAPNLRKSDIVRIALNRFLGLANCPTEAEWETRIGDLLDKIKKENR